MLVVVMRPLLGLRLVFRKLKNVMCEVRGLPRSGVFIRNGIEINGYGNMELGQAVQVWGF